jgi:hypothetical protein
MRQSRDGVAAIRERGVATVASVRTTFAKLCCLSVLTTAALTQATSPWTDLPVPGGVTMAGTASLGKNVAWFDGATVHAWSAVTRRFVTMPTGPSTALRLTNDWLLARDGDNWHAFSAWTGSFVTRIFTPSAQLLNGASNNNDSMVLVADAGQLHLFSAFTGTWSSRAIGPSALVSTLRHVALLAEGTLLTAADAFTGQWHDLTVPNVVGNLSSDGTAGFADDGGRVYAFSASHRSWRQATLPDSAQFVRGDDWGVFWSGSRQLGYSAIRGEFATAGATVSAVTTAQDLFALLTTPQGALAYSACRGTFSGPHGQANATPVVGSAVAMFQEPTGVLAYGAVLDRAEFWARPATAGSCAGVVAFVTDNASNRPVLFSALTGTFRAAPANALATPPLLTTTIAAVPTTTGLLAWNARNAAFVPAPGSPIGFTGNPSSAPLLAWDANDLFAFDARSNRWITTPRASSAPPTVAIWRTTAMFLDGNVAFGFGVQAGSWSSITLPEAFGSWRANSESGRISTATHMLAYSALGSVLTHAQFPEFRRLQPIGTDLRVVLPVPATALCVLGAGRLLAVPIAVPGFGELALDAAALVTVAVTPPPNGDPTEVVIGVPPAPALLGVQWACQGAVLPATGAPWLTDPATVLLL